MLRNQGRIMETRLESKADDSYLPVLFLGRSGHGKSTMINYLLGEKMTSSKVNGVVRIDVINGHSAPVICHSLTQIGTKKFDKFDNHVEKISYYDTPPFVDNTDYLINKEAIEKELIEKAKLVNEKKGTLIFVISVACMDNLHYMKNHLKFLGERINAVASNIL